MHKVIFFFQERKMIQKKYVFLPYLKYQNTLILLFGVLSAEDASRQRINVIY